MSLACTWVYGTFRGQMWWVLPAECVGPSGSRTGMELAPSRHCPRHLLCQRPQRWVGEETDCFPLFMYKYDEWSITYLSNYPVNRALMWGGIWFGAGVGTYMEHLCAAWRLSGGEGEVGASSPVLSVLFCLSCLVLFSLFSPHGSALGLPAVSQILPLGPSSHGQTAQFVNPLLKINWEKTWRDPQALHPPPTS